MYYRSMSPRQIERRSPHVQSYNKQCPFLRNNFRFFFFLFSFHSRVQKKKKKTAETNIRRTISYISKTKVICFSCTHTSHTQLMRHRRENMNQTHRYTHSIFIFFFTMSLKPEAYAATTTALAKY